MPEFFPRSPHLLQEQTSALIVVDIQERLLPCIAGHATIVWNTKRLLAAAKLFGIPVVATEQYPQGLGPTVREIRDELASIGTKTRFSATECGALFRSLDAARQQLVVVGIEAHVCVLQTALDLLASGYDVFVPVDAVGSRYPRDQEIAIRRIENAGGNGVSTESVLFEWCERADRDVFKKVSQLVKELPPDVVRESNPK